MKIAVIGVGSMRAGPAVVASLAQYDSAGDHHHTLFDANEERLDLMDRFARECFRASSNAQRVVSTSELSDAFDDADHVIYCLGMDCAVRMLDEAPTEPEVVDPEEHRLSLYGGDMNRPTPPNQMSATRLKMLRRVWAPPETRDDVILRAVADHAENQRAEAASVLWLVRGVAPPESCPAETATWPREIDDEEKRRRPHQLLRIVQGQEPAQSILTGLNPMVVHDWLNRTE